MNDTEAAALAVATSEGPGLVAELYRLVVRAMGGPEKARAWLDAEYRLSDAALDVYEQEKIDRETTP